MQVGSICYLKIAKGMDLSSDVNIRTWSIELIYALVVHEAPAIIPAPSESRRIDAVNPGALLVVILSASIVCCTCLCVVIRRRKIRNAARNRKEKQVGSRVGFDVPQSTAWCIH